MKSTSHKTWQTSLLFFELLQIQILKRRGFTESKGLTESKENIVKTFKVPKTESANSRKATAIHWREASGGQEHWLIHWGWLKSDQTRTQANMLAALPLTTARDRLWWSHCLPWGHLTCRQVSLQDSSKKGQWACHTHQWFRLQLVESNRLIVKKVTVFSEFVGLSVSCYTAWFSGTM